MTAQFHERLIIDGEETPMAFCPPLPLSHPKIVAVSDEEVKKAEMVFLRRYFPDVASNEPGSDIVIEAEEEEELLALKRVLSSTACWRGYVGTWEIKDGRFYLAGLRGKYKMQGGEPLFADWFTGAVRIPKGNMLQYVHMGFGSVYEQELHVKIENGLVVKTRKVDIRGIIFDKLEPEEIGMDELEINYPLIRHLQAQVAHIRDYLEDRNAIAEFESRIERFDFCGLCEGISRALGRVHVQKTPDQIGISPEKIPNFQEDLRKLLVQANSTRDGLT